MVADRYPGVSCRSQATELWGDQRIDAVAVCVPAEGHFTLAAAALAAGMHVFVEKPLCLDPAEAKHLVEEAERRSLTLMVGHLLLYHPAVQWLAGVVRDGRIGAPMRIACTRHNSGGRGEPVGPWWGLAPHDLSVVRYLVGCQPQQIVATSQPPAGAAPGSQWVRARLDVAGGVTASLSCAIGVQHRRRRIVVEGSAGAAVFDDSDGSSLVQLYRRDAQGVLRLATSESLSTAPDPSRSQPGGASLPQPLRLECEHFVRCCREARTPLSSGTDGLRVVELLDAGARSIGRNDVDCAGLLHFAGESRRDLNDPSA